MHVSVRIHLLSVTDRFHTAPMAPRYDFLGVGGFVFWSPKTPLERPLTRRRFSIVDWFPKKKLRFQRTRELFFRLFLGEPASRSCDFRKVREKDLHFFRLKEKQNILEISRDFFDIFSSMEVFGLGFSSRFMTPPDYELYRARLYPVVSDAYFEGCSVSARDVLNFVEDHRAKQTIFLASNTPCFIVHIWWTLSKLREIIGWPQKHKSSCSCLIFYFNPTFSPHSNESDGKAHTTKQGVLLS